MTAAAIATSVKFHFGLNVADLEQSVRFYRTLLGQEPAKHHGDYAKFELDSPPLVLALHPGRQFAGGALNHLGLRLSDSAALVEAQRRLEESGMATQCQEGVECCYARQTKFWVTDPDGNLWEIYTLHEDLAHSRFDDPPRPGPAMPAQPGVVWQHRLTDPLPDHIPHADATVAEVWLEGTFNADLRAGALAALLCEAQRVLTPGGKVAVHGLAGDRPFPGKPALPGLASLVRQIPVFTEVADALRRAGFGGLYYEQLGDIHCFQVAGVELRHLQLAGFKSANADTSRTQTVLYKGPFRQLVDDQGTTFPRGRCVAVSAAHADQLRRGAADQFVFFPTSALSSRSEPSLPKMPISPTAVAADRVRFFREQGYLILRRLIPVQRMSQASDEADRLLQRQDLMSKHNLRCRWQNNVVTGACEFETFDPVIDIGPVCRDLAHDERLLQVLAELYGEPACLFKDKLILKRPGMTGYGLHQDWIAWKGFPRSFLTVVIPLDPSNVENGCTEIFPGYHTNGSLSPEDGDYHELPTHLIDERHGVPLVLDPGDVAIFGGFTPHRSAPNRSGCWRRQLYLSYNKLSDGGEQRASHYEEFHRWLRVKYGEYGFVDMYFE
jgi:catechol 2,3-dioxygenase-like lactoylglutathione lyase family enzyme